ncbi:uncharacterized protein LTR77_008386 [Saxophila tyrrhenica]|uniref:AB hydrolase-1 domain-containing protein n=1 Tax=Saxophila tyrrhenica TaxID=1690608 RepID=A0AAV9P3M9_9PEZI|nr:hypothetical protein LTR77_008386 [Saxophila tyrrhenica]
MDTISIAKDHEAVRTVLGDEKLAWLGASYGTQLATQYAELYPDNIRTIVLDGAVSSAAPSIASFVESAVSMDDASAQFFDWCDLQSPTSCPLAGHARAPKEIWMGLLKELRKSPMSTCRAWGAPCVTDPLTERALIAIAADSLYLPNTARWSLIARAIHDASIHNDASLLATSRGVLGTSNHAFYAVSCADNDHNDTSYYDVLSRETLGRFEAPLMQGFSYEWEVQQACAGLPPPTRNPPHAVDIPRSMSFPTVLIVTTVCDPMTPMSWAMGFHEEIGKDRSVLVTRDATGHTTYFAPEAYNGSTVRAMNEYLLALKVPEQSVVFDT